MHIITTCVLCVFLFPLLILVSVTCQINLGSLNKNSIILKLSNLETQNSVFKNDSKMKSILKY